MACSCVAHASTQNKYDIASLKKVFFAADAYGISHYAPMPLGAIDPADFEIPLHTLDYELKTWGIDLKALIIKYQKEVLFSEVGLGGGSSNWQ
jgi:hypothetical protein